MNMGRDYWKKTPTGFFGDDRGGGRKHRGVDTSHSTQPGTIEVPALHAGVVVGILAPESWHGFGHQVTIRTTLNGIAFDISYAHGAARTPLSMGQAVPQFATVILEGTTGATEGSCAHTEQQRVGGGFLNPLPEIKRVAAGGGAPALVPGGIPFNAHDQWVQESLNKLGYNLAVDGKRGTGTITAVKDFQSKNGLTVDGIPGIRTTEMIRHHLSAPAAGRPIVRRGSTGAHVADAQNRLRTNYPLYASKVQGDGQFGPATEAAVREFQRRAGLAVDGIIGQQTWKALGL